MSQAGPSLNMSELPPLHQQQGRVLAVIAGVWDVHITDPKDERAKWIFLQTILSNYVQLCEMGFEVHVVLSTYTVIHATLNTSHLGMFCQRMAVMLPVAVARHEYEPLPDGAYATAGTLAAKHRNIFMEMYPRGYDLFINQEDDMIVKPQHVHYFLKWSSHASVGVYPFFINVEVPVHASDQRVLTSYPSLFVNSRLQHFHLKKLGGHLWLFDTGFSAQTSQQAYMLTRQMLENITRTDTSWTTIPTNMTDTEFNVYYNSIWLTHHYVFAVPLVDLQRSYMHHGTNKYMINAVSSWQDGKMSLNEKSTTHWFQRHMNVLEFETAIHQCFGSKEPVPKRLPNTIPVKITFKGSPDPFPCQTCIQAGQSAYVYVWPPANPSTYVSEHGLVAEVTVECQDLKLEQIKDLQKQYP
jgi:hypothetical protein